ncbi:MAG: hypothetical protein HYW00_00690 [Candidatus Colwellbacteria bacterium]|nr:hypothetical protein [Candidatus Colwellbacteria bacterium]
MKTINKPLQIQWHEGEQRIREETQWLCKIIDTFSEKEKHPPSGCRHCYLRNIATLIVQGNISATEIKKDESLESFWLPLFSHSRSKIYHGSDWHQETMERIENHLITQSFQVVREPTLQQGRADLGAYKYGELDLLIEVGTVSLYKLAINLMVMERFTYLIVPNDDLLIEFIKP